MPRYIDADALTEELNRTVFYCTEQELDGVRRSLQMVVNVITASPASDVRENKRGRWKWDLADNGWADWTCSECGYTKNTDIHVTLDWNYCPNCGSYNGGGDE